MKRSNQLLGIILIVVGGIFLLDALNVISVFAGWWAIIIIIIGAYSMYKNGISVGNTLITALGVFLFLKEQNIAAEAYILPAFLVLLGLAIIFKK